MARRKARQRAAPPLRVVPPTASDAGEAPSRSRAVRIGRTAALAGAMLYLLGISAYLLTHGGWPTPDYLVPPLLLMAIALGRGWSFLFDWGPFLLLVLSWQATAGLADQFGRPVHVQQVADAEQWLFRGSIPTLELQERLFNPGRAHWYDWAATIQHTLHFVLPVAMGFVIWLRGRRLYWRYLLSVMCVFYIGFAGYVFYPAAPPWMAGLQDVIPPVHRVAVETVLRLPASAPIGLAYTHFSANQVAAMPSLHAALPLLLALIMLRLWRWWALPALLYPLTMGFNLVYLGEHYAVDVLAGYGAALFAFVLVWVIPDLLPLHLPRLRLRPVTAPAALRLAGNALLPAVAIGSIAVIAATLRPGRAENVAGPVVPGLQVQAGQAGLLAPVPCDVGSSPSLTAGNLLQPVAGRWSVYLFDVDEGTCYSLSADVPFPPPRTERAPALAARAPVRLAPLSRLRQGVEYFALRIGPAAPALIATGFAQEHRYLLLVELADVPDPEQAALAVDELAALTIVSEPVPGEPESPPPPPETPLPETPPPGPEAPAAMPAPAPAPPVEPPAPGLPSESGSEDPESGTR
jgi:membrane-associated phospholipid phosphatase